MLVMSGHDFLDFICISRSSLLPPMLTANFETKETAARSGQLRRANHQRLSKSFTWTQANQHAQLFCLTFNDRKLATKAHPVWHKRESSSGLEPYIFDTKLGTPGARHPGCWPTTNPAAS